MKRNSFGSLTAVSGPQCRLPLIVGVTGHRDLREEHIGALRREIRETLLKIRLDYLGSDSNTPLIVMSSLAEGADQLVATVALELGALLVSPLPMPADEYRRDFSPGACTEFDRLLSHSVTAPQMPFVDGNNLEAIRGDTSRRALQYKEAGLYILRHCHILLALWDGETSEIKTGGTAEILSFRRAGFLVSSNSPVRDCIASTAIGPVIVISTPRKSSRSQNVNVSTLPWGRQLFQTPHVEAEQKSEAETWREFEVHIGLTVDYNRDAARILSSSNGLTMFKQGLVQLMFAPVSQISTDARRLILHESPLFCATYAMADLLARYYQRRFMIVWRSLFVLAFLMAVALGVPSIYPEIKSYGLAVYQGLFFCSFAIYLFARRREYLARYLDYRALSEAARVAVFWKIVGIEQSVADAYPLCQTPELSWIPVSLRSLDCLHGVGDRGVPRIDHHRYDICRAVWVQGQLDYYLKRGAHHAGLAKRSKILSAGFVVAAGIGTILIGLSKYFSTTWKFHMPFGSAAYIPLTLELMPAAAAAIQGYAEQLGRNAQAMQFQRMSALFSRTLTILPDSVENSQAERIREVFQDLGCESLQEAASWTSIFRLRPVKPV
jgi:hypothetical protein